MKKHNRQIGASLISFVILSLMNSPAYAIPVLERLGEQIEGVVEGAIGDVFGGSSSSTTQSQQSPDRSGIIRNNSVNAQSFDISGFRLYMTSTEVMQRMEELRASQAGISEIKIEHPDRTMCASDEANLNISQMSGNPTAAERNCYGRVQYIYTSQPGEVGDYTIIASFVENLPESPNTSVVSRISYRRQYPGSYPQEEVYETVLSRYGSPSILNTIDYDQGQATTACWGSVSACSDGPSLSMDLPVSGPGLLPRGQGGIDPGTYALTLELKDDLFKREKIKERHDYLEYLMRTNRPNVPEGTF